MDRNDIRFAQNFEHVSLQNADGTPQRWRRNGKTQLWKTRPSDFRIPIKRGLKEFHNITQLNAQDFEVIS